MKCRHARNCSYTVPIPQDFLPIPQLWLYWNLPETRQIKAFLNFHFYLRFFFQVISQWLMDQPPLGHKAPRPGLGRLAFCPACPAFFRAPSPLSSRHFLVLYIYHNLQSFYRHVLESCMAVETVRQREGIRSFLDECHRAGLSSEAAYRFFISGLDKEGIPIPVKDHLSRGGSLLKLTEEWLDIWEPRE